ncbi:hypothetical protein BKA58DRAFT_442487 [Alternaria rosae]|uniref:uncharacterized protein n=1 Tax=Alternaria rosae TaxID=1187941 RepID=UPI001E8EBD09|nr:uncharacterized protein BKA58DRAFT_442487 [Alternaria rosae]KAH6865713.1 hypothetical protein BKA58DRAFT_442487 [Alternaria rosae]
MFSGSYAENNQWVRRRGEAFGLNAEGEAAYYKKEVKGKNKRSTSSYSEKVVKDRGSGIHRSSSRVSSQRAPLPEAPEPPPAVRSPNKTRSMLPKNMYRKYILPRVHETFTVWHQAESQLLRLELMRGMHTKPPSEIVASPVAVRVVKAIVSVTPLSRPILPHAKQVNQIVHVVPRVASTMMSSTTRTLAAGKPKAKSVVDTQALANAQSIGTEAVLHLYMKMSSTTETRSTFLRTTGFTTARGFDPRTPPLL